MSTAAMARVRSWPAVASLGAVACCLALLVPTWIQLALLCASVGVGVALWGSWNLLRLALLFSGLSLTFLTQSASTSFVELGGSNLDGVRTSLLVITGLLLCGLTPRLLVGVRDCLPYVIFIAFFGLSFLWAPSVDQGLRYYTRLLWPPLAFVLAREFVRREGLEPLRGALLFSAAIGFLGNLLAPLISPSDRPDLTRFGGTTHPNALGRFAGMHVLILSNWYSKAKIRLEWLLAGLLLLVLLATGSRTSLIAAVVAVLVFAVSRRRGHTAVFVLVAAAAAWLLQPALGQRTFVHTTVENSFLNLSGRTVIWQVILHGMVATAPVFGHGVGSSFTYVMTYLPGIAGAHNGFLQILAETGLVGLALFLGAMAAVFVRLGPLVRREGEIGTVASLALAGFAMSMILMLGDNSLLDAVNFTMYPWVLFGAALGAVDRIGRHDHAC